MVFFIIFTRFSVVRNCVRPESAGLITFVKLTLKSFFSLSSKSYFLNASEKLYTFLKSNFVRTFRYCKQFTYLPKIVQKIKRGQLPQL